MKRLLAGFGMAIVATLAIMAIGYRLSNPIPLADSSRTVKLAKEAILESRPRGAGGGLAALIPQGMRVVAVPVNEVVGVAGFVRPGMHVDVIISGTPPGGSGTLGTETRTLLQNIEVISAWQDSEEDARGRLVIVEGKPVTVRVVNLLVTPDQAELVRLASHQTTIQLVLRNPLDR